MKFLARRLAAVILGVSAWAGGVSAGDAPQQLPPVVAPAQAAPLLPPEAAPTSGGIVMISGTGGCVGGCASAAVPAAAACEPCAKKHGQHPWAIGAGCASPIGCSNAAAEKTFFFGSCRQFYTPGYSCSGGLCGGPKCKEAILYGPGGYTEPNCTYGSFANR